MQEKSYRDRFGISQSMWKGWRFQSPKEWKRLHIDNGQDIDKKEETFTLGSFVDTLLFSPELINERFLISDIPKLPSVAVQTIAKSIYDEIHKYNIELKAREGDLPEFTVGYLPYDLEDSNKILKYASTYEDRQPDGSVKIGWHNNWKDDTVFNKFKEEAQGYFDFLVKAGGRKIISSDMNMLAVELRDILFTNSDVKDYFVPSENNELIFQLEIFVDHVMELGGKTLPLKGALDIVRIDHTKQTIQIIDFKTTVDSFNFITSIRKYGYCDQLSFYTYLLRLWLKNYCEGKYCDYRIIAPINICISAKEKYPYIYEYEWDDIIISEKGNKEFLYDLYQTHNHGRPIKEGWRAILEEIAWHYFSDSWIAPKELLETKRIKVKLW